MTGQETPERELEAFAQDPQAWSDPQEVLTGGAAARYGSSILEAAGVEIAAVDRAVGRPRVSGKAGDRGIRSPRVNVAIAEETEIRLEAAAKERGMSRSAIVREALDQYLGQVS